MASAVSILMGWIPPGIRKPHDAHRGKTGGADGSLEVDHLPLDPGLPLAQLFDGPSFGARFLQGLQVRLDQLPLGADGIALRGLLDEPSLPERREMLPSQGFRRVQAPAQIPVFVSKAGVKVFQAKRPVCCQNLEDGPAEPSQAQGEDGQIHPVAVLSGEAEAFLRPLIGGLDVVKTGHVSGEDGSQLQGEVHDVVAAGQVDPHLLPLAADPGQGGHHPGHARIGRADIPMVHLAPEHRSLRASAGDGRPFPAQRVLRRGFHPTV